jgi:hypothetical protein
MAVRLEEQAPRRDWVQARKDALAHLPAIVVVGGLLLYGFLSLTYQQFYGSLGVDPNDVGLTYVGTLARSSGFVIFCLIFAFAGFTGVGAILSSSGLLQRETDWWWIRLFIYIAIAVALVLLAWAISYRAQEAAKAVKAGKAVQPLVWGSFPSPVLAIHADPAIVEPTGKPGESPAIDRLQSAKLLYLGQAGGTVVFYSPADKGPLYAPASSIILHLTNCDAMPRPDPACPPPGESY